MIGHLLAHFFGLDDLAGPIYGFWSGSGSVILPWLMQCFTIGLLFWWHHQCHVDGCYRYARRGTAAGERACQRHHPHPRRTVEDIHAAHHEAVRNTGSEAT